MRLSSGKSQKNCAKDVGLSLSQLERIENGKVDISLKIAELFAVYFQRPITEIICQKSERTLHFHQPKGLQNGEVNTINVHLTKEEVATIKDLLSRL